MNTTICSVHNTIISECQNFLSREIRSVEKLEPYSPDTTSEEIEDLRRSFEDYISEVESYISEVNSLIYDIDLSSIANLAEEAKELGQKMEDGLKARKAIMENNFFKEDENITLEDVYQDDKYNN